MITTLLLTTSLLLAQQSPARKAQPMEKETAPAPRASLVLAHLAPTAPTVSVWVNGTEVTKRLAYGATALANVATDKPARIELRAADKTVFSTSARLQGGFFALPVFGTASKVTAEAMEIKPVSGKAVIQIFHAADADPVRIVMDGSPWGSKNPLAYGNFHQEALAPGKHMIAIQRADKTIASKEFDLKAGTCTSFFAVSNNGQIEIRSASHIPVSP
jgi:hypothetical protein